MGRYFFCEAMSHAGKIEGKDSWEFTHIRDFSFYFLYAANAATMRNLRSKFRICVAHPLVRILLTKGKLYLLVYTANAATTRKLLAIFEFVGMALFPYKSSHSIIVCGECHVNEKFALQISNLA